MVYNFKIFIFKIILIFPIIFLYSCGGPSMHAMNAYKDCGYKYENIVDVDQCANSMMQTFASQYGAGSVYGRSDPDLQVYKGLVYKVKTNHTGKFANESNLFLDFGNPFSFTSFNKTFLINFLTIFSLIFILSYPSIYILFLI